MKHSTASLGLLAPARLPGPGRLVIPSSGQAPRPRPQPQPRQSFDAPTVPLPVGVRDDKPVLVLKVIDESASEQSLDPRGHRHVAGRRTLALLRDELRQDGDRMAVVHFTDQPTPWLGPTDPHSKAGYVALRRSLAPSGSGGGTDIVAALKWGARLVPGDWPGEVVAILLSDGQDSSTSDQLREAVGRFPAGAVHVISIGSPLPAQWAGVPLGSTTVVPSMARPDEVEWTTARALYGALDLELDPLCGGQP